MQILSESQFVLFIIAGAILLGIIYLLSSDKHKEEERKSKLSPEELQEERESESHRRQMERRTALYGPINPFMTCPHCNNSSCVRTKPITQKKGISGGKATAALLTGGITILGTGLSRKEKNTQAECDVCGNSWVF